MSPPAVRVRVIGTGEIVVGRTHVRPDAAVLFALLLYLSVRAGERVSRAELLEFLWTGMPDAARRHSLRQIVYRVRRAGLELDDGNELTIECELIDSDLNALLTDDWVGTVAIADIPAPSTVLASCNVSVTPAFAEWVESVRQNAQMHIRRAALRHIARARREGRWADVESVARTCLATDPLNEEATLALAEATAMSGAKAEAMRILDAYVWEIGDKAKEIGLPAKLLRRRISDQQQFRMPRSGEAPLMGREKELAWLNDRLEATEDSRRSAILVGPPGIGKTAVVRAFVAQVEMRGWRAPQARLQPSDVSRPMSVFVELLPGLMKMEGAAGASPESMTLIRQLLQHDDPGTADTVRMLDAPAFPARVAAAIVDLLSAVAEEGPLVVVLEDLHWIDAQSLRWLVWLTEQIAPRPVLVLITARPENQFAALNDALPVDRVMTHDISPLDGDTSARLFASLAARVASTGKPDVVSRAHALTGGNPLFIHGIAAQWNETGDTDELPSSLRELIRARVSHFTPASQRVLHTCAMLGRYASVTRVSRILEIPTAELLSCVEELDSLGLVGVAEELGSLALHDLWQEELLAGLRTGARALLHLRCGEILEAEANETRAAGLVHDAARHLIAAGVSERAIRLLEEAATYQLANGFTEAAVETSRRAMEAGAQSDARDRLRSLHLQALQAAGDLRGILNARSGLADRIAATASHDEPHSSDELLVIDALWRTGADMANPLEAALRCAEDSRADATHRAAACLLAAQIAANFFRSDGLERARQALSSIPCVSDVAAGVTLAATLVLETEVGSLARALACAEQLVAYERSRASMLGLVRALRFIGYPLRAVGRSEEAFALTSEAYDIATRYQLIEQAAQAASTCATLRFSSGDILGATEWADRTEQWAKKSTAVYVQRCVKTSRADIALRSGDSDAADRLVSEVEADASFASDRERLEILQLRADLCVATQNLDRLEVVIEEMDAQLKRSRSCIRQDDFVVAFVHGLRALGRGEEAIAYARAYLKDWRRDTAPAPLQLLRE